MGREEGKKGGRRVAGWIGIGRGRATRARTPSEPAAARIRLGRDPEVTLMLCESTKSTQMAQGAR